MQETNSDLLLVDQDSSCCRLTFFLFICAKLYSSNTKYNSTKPFKNTSYKITARAGMLSSTQLLQLQKVRTGTLEVDTDSGERISKYANSGLVYQELRNCLFFSPPWSLASASHFPVGLFTSCLFSCSLVRLVPSSFHLMRPLLVSRHLRLPLAVLDIPVWFWPSASWSTCIWVLIPEPWQYVKKP